MSDDDLIRRGDVLALQDRFMGLVCVEKIAAIPAVTPGVRSDPAVTASDYLDAAVSKAPQSLKELGKWLSRVLDEDQWPTAERLLNAAALDLTPQPAPDVVGVVEAMKVALEVMEAVDGENDCSRGIDVLEKALAAMEGKP